MALQPAAHAASSTEDLIDKTNPGVYSCVVTVLTDLNLNLNLGLIDG